MKFPTKGHFDRRQGMVDRLLTKLQGINVLDPEHEYRIIRRADMWMNIEIWDATDKKIVFDRGFEDYNELVEFLCRSYEIVAKLKGI